MQNPFKKLAMPTLTLKQRQWVTAIAGGVIGLGVVFLISSMLGGPNPSHQVQKQLPSPRTLGVVPGGALNDREAWMGAAGQDVAEIKKHQGELERENETMKAQIRELSSRGSASSAVAAPPPGTTAPTQVGAATPGVPSPVQPGSTVRSPPYPAQTGAQAAGAVAGRAEPARWSYPPGTPAATPIGANGGAAPPPDAGPGMIRVSLAQLAAPSAPAAPVDPKAASPAQPPTAPSAPGTANTAVPHTTDTYLPINFTPARLLGGMLAPTGGQAQSNPVPALIELTDSAQLPDEFRANVAKAFVTVEGYGDISSERVHLRLLRLSYITKDGVVGEEKVSGVAYGPDGMEGIKGNLVQKTGQILANALLASIPAAIGRGFAASSMTTSVSALGTTQTANPSETFKNGLAQGTSNAMDRLAQYYIQLAEQIHPVIEIFGDQKVDLLFTSGVVLHTPLAAATPAVAGARANPADHARLLSVVNAND